MTDIVVHTGVAGGMPTDAEIDRAVRIAGNLAASGMFKDANQASQAFAKIMLGRDLGLSPTQAMTSIHVVEGKPELSANLQAQLVKTYRGPDGERYDYERIEYTDEVVAIEFKRRRPGESWESLGVERFTMDDANRAGLVRANSPWTKYPRNMLWARCISNGVNSLCPEVARGLRAFGEGELSGEEPAIEPTETAAGEPPREQIVDATVVDDVAQRQLTNAGLDRIAGALADERVVAEQVLRAAGFDALKDVATVGDSRKVRVALNAALEEYGPVGGPQDIGAGGASGDHAPCMT